MLTCPRLVSNQGAPAAGGTGIACIDQGDSCLRDRDAGARSDRGAGDVCAGASNAGPNFGRRGKSNGRGGGGREGAGAGSAQGPGLPPMLTCPGLVSNQGAPAAGGIGIACIDQGDSCLHDRDAGARIDWGAGDVCAGASNAGPNRGRRGQSSGYRRGQGGGWDDGGSLNRNEVMGRRGGLEHTG